MPRRLSDNIRSAREELGRKRGRKVTQEEVANAVGMAVRLYQRHERGGEGDLMVLTLLRIAQALETTAEALLRGVTLDPSEPDDAPAVDAEP